MNTQTHILLASALFARPGRPLRNSAAIAGALLPDATIFVMWAYGRSTGVQEKVIWDDMYWRPEWQEASAITNSLPLFTGVVLVSALVDAPSRVRFSDALFSARRVSAIADALLIFSLAAIVHIATDFPLHVDDGHPPFWPFSGWIFRSGISYWDPRFFGTYVSLAETVFAVGLIALLWARFRSVTVRFVLVLLALSYAIVAHHWTTSFG